MIKIEDSIYIVKPGKVVYGNKGIVHYASSTVTLIDDGSLILADTGLGEDWPIIKAGIEKAGFSPSEIGVLVNTHLHLDHIGCNDKCELPLVKDRRLPASTTELAQRSQPKLEY